MKYIWLLLLCLYGSITLSGQDGREEYLNSEAFFGIVKTKLLQFIRVHKALSNDPSKSDYKGLFNDWGKIKIEDFYVDESVLNSPAESPKFLFISKFNTEATQTCRFRKVGFQFSSPKLFCDPPKPFSDKNLKTDPIGKHYFNVPYLDKNKFKGYHYLKTAIESQAFVASKDDPQQLEVDRTDKIMIHWIFKLGHGVSDFKVISIHNYGSYPFQHNITNIKARSFPRKKKFPDPLRQPAKLTTMEFVHDYISILNSRQNNEVLDLNHFKGFFMEKAKVAVDFIDNGKPHELKWNQYFQKMREIPALKQSFELVEGPLYIQNTSRKDRYRVAIRTRATTLFCPSDSLCLKNVIPLNMVVIFDLVNKQATNLKIAEIKYNGKIAQSEEPPPSGTPLIADRDTIKEELLRLLEYELLIPQELTSRFNVRYDINNIGDIQQEIPGILKGLTNGNLKAKISLLKDKAIYIELSKRIVVFNAKVKLIITPEKIIIARDIPFFKPLASEIKLEAFQQTYGLAQLDFASLQAILTGTPILEGDFTKSVREYGELVYETCWQEVIKVHYSLDPLTKKLKNTQIHFMSGQTGAVLQFANYFMTESGKIFPGAINFNLKSTTDFIPQLLTFEEKDFTKNLQNPALDYSAYHLEGKYHIVAWDTFFEEFAD